MDLIIYDKYSWHLDNGIDSVKLNAYFQQLAAFLQKHQLLNVYGLEILSSGIDSSLSITSKMLTDKGNSFLSTWYDKHLESIDLNANINLTFLEEKIAKM
jgi:hypothetical protein